MIAKGVLTTMFHPIHSSKVFAKMVSKLLLLPCRTGDSYSFFFFPLSSVNCPFLSLFQVIVGAAALTEQVSTIVNLVIVYIFLSGPFAPQVVLVVTAITLLGCVYFLLQVTSGGCNWCKNALVCLLGGFILSPALKTLTETISTDTIYLMVSVMLLIHLATFDYGVDFAIVSQSVSLNVAIFATVCLASRLSTTYYALVLLVFAADILVLYTALRIEWNKLHSPQIRFGRSLALNLLTIISVSTALPIMYAYFYTLLLFILNLLLPFIFFKMQVLRENIHGPWDEAVIRKNGTQ